MKAQHPHLLTFGTLGLVMPAAADVIYSNLQDIAIPANFDGLYLDVNTGNSNTSMASPQAGWDINPFYGGKNVQNSPGFQPVRTTPSNTSAIVNLAAGTGVGSGSTYSSFTWDHDNNSGTAQVPGYGSSQMLSGSGGNFTGGAEGYIGFKLYTDATYTTANYGWMRVVFTNNTGGAVIKDWAYDNTGGTPINTGNVLQSAAVNSAQTVTLNSAAGSFSFGSAITNTGGNTNSVLKTGAGTTTLTGANSYTGATTIHAGTLALGATGSIANSTTLVVGDTGSSGAVLDVTAKSGGFTVGAGQTLKGIGTVNGAVAINGTLAPGNSIESLATGALTFNGGSTFAYEMNSSAGTADLLKVSGDVTLNDTVNLTLDDLADPDVAFAPGTKFSLINYTGMLSGGFFYGEPLGDGESFLAGLNNWTITYGDAEGGANFIGEYFGGADKFVNLTLTAIPEPGSLLALGCLVGSGVLLRSRRRR